jgi:hypothetical protein
MDDPELPTYGLPGTLASDLAALQVNSQPDNPPAANGSANGTSQGVSDSRAGSISISSARSSIDNTAVDFKDSEHLITNTFFQAIANGQDDLISQLIDNGLVDLSKIRNNLGHTPLFAAVDSRQTRIVQQIMDYEVEVDQFARVYEPTENDKLFFADKYYLGLSAIREEDMLSLTPLMRAAQIGHLTLVKLLMEVYHADDSIISPEGMTPLRLAVEGGHREVVNYLPSRRGGALRRLKYRNRKSIRRMKRAAHNLGRVGVHIYEIIKFLTWEIPRDLAIGTYKFCKKLPNRLARLGKRTYGACKKLPHYVSKLAKFIWGVIKEIPSALKGLAIDLYKFFTVVLPHLVAKGAKFVWRFLTQILPKLLAVVGRWIWNMLVKTGQAIGGLVARIASLIHTVFAAILSFFQRITLQDIVNGVKTILDFIFVSIPKGIWKGIVAAGKGIKAMGQICFDGVGMLGKCIIIVIFAIGLGIYYTVVWIATQIITIPVSIATIIGRYFHELMVWIDPKAGV